MFFYCQRFKLSLVKIYSPEREFRTK